MHQAVQKCSGCYHYASCLEGNIHICYDTSYPFVFNQNLFNLILPDVKVWCVFKNFAPGPNEFSSVALCTRTPHCRPFTTVQHTELDGCSVGNFSHVSAQCINLPYNLSFGNAADSRIATHLCNLVHIHCYKTGLSSQFRAGSCCLASCVPCTNHHHIKIHFHISPTLNLGAKLIFSLNI